MQNSHHHTDIHTDENGDAVFTISHHHKEWLETQKWKTRYTDLLLFLGFYGAVILIAYLGGNS